ncbi:MAG: CoA transferase [Candidatus Tectomicrobia bacterium]|uniref:CoA transferase n=1 Tax=Tectimicrobiota bacterium TaxID=2528274 RepID=A0A932HXB1_UNCTE|nr:CoA transferase [Candidatus Tectomicrobia bacterium]
MIPDNGVKPNALQGLKVVECATVIAAPLCGRLMADFGAEVIHVEHPKTGDHLRQFGFSVDGINPFWKCYDRNKKFITLDISKPKGRELLVRLLRDADIFIENFRPGRLEEWGIRYEDLSRINPRLIMVRVTGYGQYGPYSSFPGFGTLMEAMSGFAAMTGEPDGPPVLPQFALADSFAAFHGALAAMFAVHYRDVVGTGVGQVIDVSIWESLYAMVGPNALAYELTGEPPKRIGNRAASAPRNTYRTKDGRWVALAASTQTMATKFFAVMGQPELIRDHRFSTNMNRVKNVDALDAIVGKWMAEHTLDQTVGLLRKSEIPVAPIYDIRDIIKDPHAKAREMVIHVPDEDKESLMMEGVFPKMTLTPGSVSHAGKRMGADNDEIFKKHLGLSELDMTDLAAEGII